MSAAEEVIPSELPKPAKRVQNRTGRVQNRTRQNRTGRKQVRPSRAEEMQAKRKQQKEEAIDTRRTQRQAMIVSEELMADSSSSSDSDNAESTDKQYSPGDRDELLEVLQEPRRHDRNSTSALSLACEDLRNDFEIVAAAVEQDPASLRFASASMVSNEGIVLAAIHATCEESCLSCEKHFPLRYASQDLRRDSDLVLTATLHGEGFGGDHNLHAALRYAATELRSDVDFALQALVSSCYPWKVWKELSSQCRRNEAVALAAITEMRGYWKEFGHSVEMRGNWEPGCAMVDEIAFTFNDEPKIMFEVLQLNGALLSWAADSIRNNKTVVLAALEASKDCSNIIFINASSRLRNDKAVVLAAVRKSWRAIEYVSARLQDDREVLVAALALGVGALQFASNELRDDFDLIIDAIRNKSVRAFDFASRRLQQDPEILFAAISQDKKYIHSVPRNADEISGDEVEEDELDYEDGEEEDVENDELDYEEGENEENDDDIEGGRDLLGNKEFMMKLITGVDRLMFFFASKELKANLEFVSEVARQFPTFYETSCYLAQIKVESGLFEEAADILIALLNHQKDRHETADTKALENAQHFARLVLADHLVVRGRLDDAQHQLRAILSKAPCALAHLKLGLILDLAGNQEGAKEELIACTHLDPLLIRHGLRNVNILRRQLERPPSRNRLLESRAGFGGYFDGHKWMRPLFGTKPNAHFADAQYHLGRLEEDQFTDSPLTFDQVTSEVQSLVPRDLISAMDGTVVQREDTWTKRSRVRSQRGERFFASAEVPEAEWKALEKANSDLTIGIYDEYFGTAAGPPDGKYKVMVFRRFRQDAYVWRYRVAETIYRDHKDVKSALNRHVERTKKDKDGHRYTDMEPLKKAKSPDEHKKGYFGYQGYVDLCQKFDFTEACLVPRLCAATPMDPLARDRASTDGWNRRLGLEPVQWHSLQPATAAAAASAAAVATAAAPAGGVAAADEQELPSGGAIAGEAVVITG